MTTMHDLVFLFDVDNTLLDNDRVQADLAAHLTEAYGVDACKLYCDIFEQLRCELGYADYLGALERFRLEKMHDPRVLRMSSFILLPTGFMQARLMPSTKSSNGVPRSPAHVASMTI
jgi:FMN phosphatase YigB (HAD superfamily)